ncbi:MAG: YczE/YyaS/YitT family protein [Candidatus Scatomorpha sp.]|jgi:uncharacterized membrane protein YczE
MENHDSRKQFAARLALLLAGLAVMAFGVALSIKAELGTSPISSLPFVTAEISGLSVGTTTIIVNSLFVLIQIVLLRRNYEWLQLLQIGIAVVFGMMIDLFGLLLEPIATGNYAAQWVLCAGGIIFVALGVSIEVAANLVPTAGEGLVLAICQVTPFKFGNMKVALDVTLVVLSVAAGFIFLGQLEGVREGTVAAALLVGQVSKFFSRYLGGVRKKLGTEVD